jgi:hypothetical protein
MTQSTTRLLERERERERVHTIIHTPRRPTTNKEERKEMGVWIKMHNLQYKELQHQQTKKNLALSNHLCYR